MEKALAGEEEYYICCSRECLKSLSEQKKDMCRQLLSEVCRRGKREVEFMLHIYFLSIIDVMDEKNDNRKRRRYSLQLFGAKLCRGAFLTVFGLSLRYFQILLRHVYDFGVAGRTHGHTGNRNNYHGDGVHTQALKFLENYGEEYGMPDPGHIRCPSVKPVILLPSSFKKIGIYIAYCLHARKAGWKIIVSKSRFLMEWRMKMPHLKVMTPAIDLCHLCLTLQHQLYRCPTLDGKVELQSKWNAHLNEVQTRRTEYKERNAFGSEEMARLQIVNDNVFESPHKTCSIAGGLTYDFDFAANMLIPHHARQEGKIYFTSPRKVYLFGVCATFTWRQVLFYCMFHFQVKY